jgi:hypothetical protein
MRVVGDALAMLTAGMARTERFRSNRPDRRPRVVAVLDIVDEVFIVVRLKCKGYALSESE